uniref:Reverse transcriptase domain-containing protein n=2 Tax=Arion vulgaris TaxID=1028688 RepID=A0A0B7BSE8_9EUPU
MVTASISLDEEINARVGSVATTFGKLSKRAWDNTKLTLQTKIQIYRACVISSLLYGSETWTAYSRHERRLNIFHLRCLRKIMNIRWYDKITNSEVLQRANLPSIMGMLSSRRLRWLGHVRRMETCRIPKQMLFCELSEGKRHQGRPLLRCKDVWKASMKNFSIGPSTWEKLADDRVVWKVILRKCTVF